MSDILGQIAKVRRARLLVTDYPSALAAWDDKDLSLGVSHPYTPLTAGQYSGVTRLSVPAYAAATIRFQNGDPIFTIFDTANGLAQFRTGDLIEIYGSASNDGFYTVSYGGTAGSFEVNEPLVEEAAGRTITICKYENHTNEVVVDSRVGLMWSRAYAGGRIGYLSDGNLYWLYTAYNYQVHAGSDVQMIAATKTCRIIGGAAEAYKFRVGMPFSTTGLNTKWGWVISGVAVDGADLVLSLWTGNNVVVDEGPGISCGLRVPGNQVWGYVAAANHEALAGHSDWRLPSANELRTLVNHGTVNGLPDPVAFPGWVASSTVWSSTTAPSGVAYAIALVFTYGVESRYSKSSNGKTLLVRTLS